MKKLPFTGAAVAIVTPMNENGSVNFAKFAEIIDAQIAAGTDAIVVCGTTGEGSTLSIEEHEAVMKFCIDKVAKRVPVIAGTGSNDTAFSVRLSKEAEAYGADALLLITPYYNKTSQKGLIAHFGAVAEAVNIPCILYSVPGRTGMNILPETCKELSKFKNIVAIKEASGNLSQIARIIALCGDDLAVYSGEDGQVVPILSLGGKGVISVLSNVAPKETHDMANACLAGDFKTGAAMQLKYLALIDALFSDVNPIPVKEAMNLMGMDVGPCRLPLVPMADALRENLKAQLAAVGLL